MNLFNACNSTESISSAFARHAVQSADDTSSTPFLLFLLLPPLPHHLLHLQPLRQGPRLAPSAGVRGMQPLEPSAAPHQTKHAAHSLSPAPYRSGSHSYAPCSAPTLCCNTLMTVASPWPLVSSCMSACEGLDGEHASHVRIMRRLALLLRRHKAESCACNLKPSNQTVLRQG